MEKAEFIRRIYDIARNRHMRIKIDTRGNQAICFNEISGSWLHQGHFALLFDGDVLRDGIGRREINDLIRDIAPGRSGAHKGMRKILDEIRSGLA